MTANRRYDRSEVLAFVEKHIATHGYGPSIREITRACGISSTSVAAFHVRRLCDEGALCFTPGLSRSLTLGRRSPLVEDVRAAVGALRQGQDALPGLVELLRRLEG